MSEMDSLLLFIFVVGVIKITVDAIKDGAEQERRRKELEQYERDTWRKAADEYDVYLDPSYMFPPDTSRHRDGTPKF